MDPEAVRATDRVPHGSSDDSSLLDFSANTNPTIPEGVTSVFERSLDASRTYPPEPPRAYCEAAADYVGCDEENVIPTPGGMAALRLAIELAVEPGDSVLVPKPSFGEYHREVRLQGCESVFVPHDEILAADPTEHALAIVCNPNNPTGDCYDEDALASFVAQCRETDTTLLVDEAFLDFTDRPSLAGTDGVIVARSLTKLFGLPGLRIGFAVAAGTQREALAAARPPWNVGTPALEVGTYCLRQIDFVRDTRERVRTERERMRERLAQRFGVFPSEAPFLLLDVGDRDVCEVLRMARNRGIELRDATTFRGLDSHVRVAVRLPEENDRLVEVLTDV
ncbi:MAG: threonine-phosphate decarboxylase CobD [Halobacteriota archaeon]